MIAPRWRALAGFIGLLGALTVLGLAVKLHGRRDTHFDLKTLQWLYGHVTGVWARITIDSSLPPIGLTLLAVVALIALLTRRYRLVALAVAAPAVASGLTQFVLKPWVGRAYGDYTSTAASLSYPSGHETLVASAALVTLLALLRLPVSSFIRVVGALVLFAWAVCAGVGLVVNFYHYTTDIIGAIGLCLAVVLGGALLLDRVSSPAGRGLARKARGA